MDSRDLLTRLLAMRLGERPVELETLRQGLRAENPRIRHSVLPLAARRVEDVAPELLALFFRAPELRSAARLALAADPALRLECRRPAALGVTAPSPLGPPVQRAYAPERLARVLAVVAANWPSAEAELLLDGLPGLHQALAFSPISPLSEGQRQLLARRFREREADRFPGAVAVVPSYRCGRACSYCFAKELAARGGVEMDLERFRQVLDAVGVGGAVRRVNLFGGEPTEFPLLEDFVRELEARQVRFFFSTNGLGDPARFRRVLASGALEMVTLHLERPAAYRGEELATLKTNSLALAGARAQVVLRYNLTEAAARDFGFLAPWLRALPRAHVAYAVAFPSESRANLHATLEELDRFAPKALALAEWLERESPGRRVVLAKPFPVCAFGPEALGQFLARVDYHAVCEVNRNGFADQVQVAPNGTMSPCMALSSPALALPEPRPLPEAGRAFAQRLAPLMARPPRPSCARCTLFEVGACQAACYAYLQ